MFWTWYIFFLSHYALFILLVNLVPTITEALTTAEHEFLLFLLIERSQGDVNHFCTVSFRSLSLWKWWPVRNYFKCKKKGSHSVQGQGCKKVVHLHSYKSSKWILSVQCRMWSRIVMKQNRDTTILYLCSELQLQLLQCFSVSNKVNCLALRHYFFKTIIVCPRTCCTRYNIYIYI